MYQSPVGGHDVDRDEIVQREPVLALQAAHTPAESQAGHAGVRDDADGTRQAEGLGLVVELGQERAAVHSRHATLGIDADASHARQVDDESSVARGEARDAVSSAPDGDRELVISSEPERGEDVGDAGRPDHDRRTPVDHAVPHDPGRVVARVVRQNDLPREGVAEHRERRRIERSRHLS
jgi:hypothetical protein